MKSYLVLALICLSAGACSSTPSGNTTAQADVVCTKETPIGSHMAQKHCTTAAEREKTRQRAAEAMSTPDSKQPAR
jgi:uncharacterized protein YcfL